VQPQVAAHHPAELEQLRQDLVRHTDRDGETDALRWLDHGRVDADHPGMTIDQRAA